MKTVRHFDEVYEEFMNKNKDYFDEVLDNSKNQYTNHLLKLLITCLIIGGLFILLINSAIEKGLIDAWIKTLATYCSIVIICIYFIVMWLHYYVADNKIPEEIQRTVEEYFVSRIFTEIFPVYNYTNCHEESSPELKDKIGSYIEEEMIVVNDNLVPVKTKLEDVKIIEKITTTINSTLITIYGAKVRYVAEEYGVNTVYRTYVEGMLKKQLSGTLKVIYDEENLPTGVDEFTDYYRVECDKMDKDQVLTDGVKEAFVNTRDEGKDLNLYMKDNNFIMDACPGFCINYYTPLVKHGKINQEWARQRYGVYLHIYNAIDELTKEQ